MTQQEDAVQVLIAVDEEYLGRISEVAELLRAVGLNVQIAIDRAGTIIGSTPASNIKALSQVEGVWSVEVAHIFQVPHPNANEHGEDLLEYKPPGDGNV
jgi:hypothetical protein